MDNVIKQKLDNSAGFLRAEMPQIDFEDVQYALAILISKGIGIQVKSIPAKKIKFAQSEIDEKKIDGKIKDKSTQYKKRIYFVSKGLFVVDGHHDLGQALKVNPDTKLVCLVCDRSIYKLIPIFNKMVFTKNAEI